MDGYSASYVGGHNFTASYDTRGVPGRAMTPQYWSHGLDQGYDAATRFPQRYYNRQGETTGQPLWKVWDDDAIADPAYFYNLYGEGWDPMWSSIDGIQSPAYMAEQAVYRRVANQHYSNWLGRYLVPSGQHAPRGLRRSQYILQDELPQPYVLVRAPRDVPEAQLAKLVTRAGGIYVYLDGKNNITGVVMGRGYSFG
jgi:hypothetical protein